MLKRTSGKNITIKMYIRVVKECTKRLNIQYKTKGVDIYGILKKFKYYF